jgi:hypothetical protein
MLRVRKRGRSASWPQVQNRVGFLIQSTYGQRGNFEVVYSSPIAIEYVGWTLQHYSRNNDMNSPSPWSGPLWTWQGNHGFGGTALIQSSLGSPGNFEVVTTTELKLAHFYRNNSDPNLPWSGPTSFGSDIVEGMWGGVALIKSNFGDPGNFEVVALADSSESEGSDLVHYHRNNSDPNLPWHGPVKIGTGVRGTPALIQSSFGNPGNFEVVVGLEEGGLAHYYRDNSDPNLPWSGPTLFGQDMLSLPIGLGIGYVKAVSLIQSNFGNPGNFEVVALTYGADWQDLAHYYRDNADPNTPWARVRTRARQGRATNG